MKHQFTFHKNTQQLFSEQGEIQDLRHDKQNNPYFVFPDSPQHWIKFHLTNQNNLKRVFYKKIDTYYLRYFSPPRKRNIISFVLDEKQEVEKQLWGWEKKNKSQRKPPL